jgi:GNAT superfamily N-acetyltransferase
MNKPQFVSFEGPSQLYRRSMEFLVENLPMGEMKITASRLRSNPNTYQRTLVCLDGEKIAGVSMGGQLDQDRSYLQFMLILPEYRKEGIGKLFLDTFEARELSRNVSIIEADTYDPRVTEWMVRQGYKIFRREGNVVNHVKNFR